MVKRALLLTILALAVPLSAFADSFSAEFFYSGNLLGNSGESLYGSSNIYKLVGYPTRGTLEGSNLGQIIFRTGPLVSGSLEHGGTFSSLGSGFSIFAIIFENGVEHIPQVFSGIFDSPLTWTLTTLADGTHTYVLDGTVSGSYGSGFQTTGTVEVAINTGKTLFHSGDTYEVTGGETLIAVPEPSSLFLLGTGLVGVVGAVRRKLRG